MFVVELVGETGVDEEGGGRREEGELGKEERRGKERRREGEEGEGRRKVRKGEGKREVPVGFVVIRSEEGIGGVVDKGYHATICDTNTIFSSF